MLLCIALQLLVGSSLPWVDRELHSPSNVFRSPAMALLLLHQVCVAYPLAWYLLINNGDWAFMYVLNSKALPLPLEVFAAVPSLAAIIAFLYCKKLLTQEKQMMSWLVMGLYGAALAAIIILGQTQLLTVTNYDSYVQLDNVQLNNAQLIHANVGTPLLGNLTHSSLWPTLPVALVALLVSWGFSWQRLRAF